MSRPGHTDDFMALHPFKPWKAVPIDGELGGRRGIRARAEAWEQSFAVFGPLLHASHLAA